MRKVFFIALPLAVMLLAAGCEQNSRTAAGSSSSPAAVSPAPAQAAAPAPSQPQPQYRRSTTQPLPEGWGYLHDQDLLSANTPAPNANN